MAVLFCTIFHKSNKVQIPKNQNKFGAIAKWLIIFPFVLHGMIINGMGRFVRILSGIFTAEVTTLYYRKESKEEYGWI
jgi:hypothetical protein